MSFLGDFDHHAHLQFPEPVGNITGDNLEYKILASYTSIDACILLRESSNGSQK